MTAGASPRRGVAVVIGSGSVKCAAALGLVNALNRAGIGIDMLVGCSAGCLYATLIASGRSTAEAAEMTRHLWTSEITDRHDRLALVRAIFPRLFGFTARFGLRDDRLIMARLREAFGDARIENMKIPLHLTATDFATSGSCGALMPRRTSSRKPASTICRSSNVPAPLFSSRGSPSSGSSFSVMRR